MLVSPEEVGMRYGARSAKVSWDSRDELRPVVRATLATGLIFAGLCAGIVVWLVTSNLLTGTPLLLVSLFFASIPVAILAQAVRSGLMLGRLPAWIMRREATSLELRTRVDEVAARIEVPHGYREIHIVTKRAGRTPAAVIYLQGAAHD